MWCRKIQLGVIAFGLSVVLIGIQSPGPALAQEEEAAEEQAQEQAQVQDVAIRVMLTEADLPVDDPFAAAWDEVDASNFHLAPQVHWPDRLLDATAKSVSVRGLHNGDRLAVLVEYQDPTQDAADAAAVEFMVGEQKAHFAHGQEMLQVKGGPVNIWYWKNSSGKAVDMSAKGFGTLRPQKHQDVTATGEWRDGTWRVVFSRALATENVDEDAQIVPGQWTNIAFAMWDGKVLASGEAKEKGSQKAVSSWLYFRAEPPADYSVFFWAFLGLGIAVLFEFALIKKLKKGQAA